MQGEEGKEVNRKMVEVKTKGQVWKIKRSEGRQGKDKFIRNDVEAM